MSKKAKWKQALQASNILLEFEASRVLVSSGFTVEPDFKYAWRSSGLVRESSIDMHAASVLPFPENAERPELSEAGGKIELLVECVHGNADAAWLFMPESGTRAVPDIVSGGSIRVMDHFSSYVFDHGLSNGFDSAMPLCRKGFEIDMETGEVSEENLGRGIEKLQYVLPKVITDNVLFYLTVRLENNVPFIVCPVLLTTVGLHVIRKDVTADMIGEASDFREIADPVPCLVMHSGIGPDFEYQCGHESNRMKGIQRTENAALVEQKRARHFGARTNLPFTVMEALMAGHKDYLNTYFTRFVICNNRHFPELVDTIKQTSEKISGSKQWIE